MTRTSREWEYDPDDTVDVDAAVWHDRRLAPDGGHALVSLARFAAQVGGGEVAA